MITITYTGTSDLNPNDEDYFDELIAHVTENLPGLLANSKFEPLGTQASKNKHLKNKRHLFQVVLIAVPNDDESAEATSDKD